MPRLIPMLAAAAILLPAHAAMNTEERQLQFQLDSLALPANAQHIEAVMSYLWFGLPLAARRFDSPGPIADVVRHLQSVQPIWRDVRVQPGAIVLSGRNNVVQWIARLTPAENGYIQVMLSTLRMPPPGWKPKRALNSDWLPGTANLRFDLMGGDGCSTQQVWTHTQLPSTLWPILIKALSVGGWTQISADRGALAPMRWVRFNERLDLSMHAHESGAAIFIHRSRE
jgi:hypothetical protein